MKNMGNMMKQMQKMQKQMMKAQEELKEKTVEATAGGGMVTVMVMRIIACMLYSIQVNTGHLVTVHSLLTIYKEHRLLD